MSRKVSNFVKNTEETEGETVTIRPSASSLFCIDSDDRYSNYGQRRSAPTYPFRFNIQKPESLLNGFFKRLALTEFRMNWTLPNISSAWGNNQMIMKWQTGSTVETDLIITIPDGFYPVQAIADALSSIISSVSPGFTVAIGDKNDDTLIFIPDQSGANVISFYFTAVTSPTATALNYSPVINTNCRQLIDMLNVPAYSTYQTTIQTGIPNMRPMDYVDVVCSQLTYNQELKDSTSALITRDMITRIYLDDMTKSQAFFVTNNYSGTTSGTLTPSALVTAGSSGNVVEFTVSTTPSAFTPGGRVAVTGITGGAGWNSTGTLLAVDTATAFGVVIAYDIAPTGTPAFSGTPLLTFYSTLTSISSPQTTWDDRVNGVTPFVIYRQFPVPKQIRWNNSMPIGNVNFELYDDQGRSIQDLWNLAYPPSNVGSGITGVQFANSFVWDCSILVSED
jgi:hypothetical protein